MMPHIAVLITVKKNLALVKKTMSALKREDTAVMVNALTFLVI